jgi:hypothetical protein
MLRIANLAAAALLFASLTHAQSADPPPDLTSPPADAVKSSTGLVSKLLVPGPATDKPIATDIVTVHYTG